MIIGDANEDWLYLRREAPSAYVKGITLFGIAKQFLRVESEQDSPLLIGFLEELHKPLCLGQLRET